MGLFILVDRKPVACPDVMQWGEWYEHSGERTVGDTTVGAMRISTIFLGIDHAWLGGATRLFETMAFGGPMDMQQERCSTWDQAETQHAAWVARARGFTQPLKVEATDADPS